MSTDVKKQLVGIGTRRPVGNIFKNFSINRNQIFATQIHLVKPPKLLQQLITNYNFELPEDTAFILRSVTLINTELSLLWR